MPRSRSADLRDVNSLSPQPLEDCAASVSIRPLRESQNRMRAARVSLATFHSSGLKGAVAKGQVEPWFLAAR